MDFLYLKNAEITEVSIQDFANSLIKCLRKNYIERSEIGTLKRTVDDLYKKHGNV